MINIISRSANEKKIGGPQKVYANLVKGLDKIGYPYVLNRKLNATKRLWIHDDVQALRYLHRTSAKTVVGPNLFVMPRDIPQEIGLEGVLYLHPSEWPIKQWKSAGFNTCPIHPWPVGIDTEEFRPMTGKRSSKAITVYHKERGPKELEYIVELLEKRRLKHNLVLYGNYSQDEYQEVLRSTSFIIWHGRHESQGIALQEAMACDVPVLVCDVTSVLQQVGGRYIWDEEDGRVRVIAAPYFDERCGMKITDLSHLEEAIQFMFDNLASFAPREYVLENLSLEGQARKWVSLWEHWGLSFESGLNEEVATKGKWPPIHDRVWQRTRPLLVKLKRRTFEMVHKTVIEFCFSPGGFRFFF